VDPGFQVRGGALKQIFFQILGGGGAPPLDLPLMYIYNLKEVANCNNGDNSKQTNEFLYVIGAGIFNNEQSLDISHQCLKGG
jgi:hypothetical protein